MSKLSTKKVESKFKVYQNLSQGLSKKNISKAIGAGLFLGALPVVGLAQGNCGAVGGVTLQGGGLQLDVDGGGVDFTFSAYNVNQAFIKVNGSFAIGFDGTNAGYPIVDRVGTGAVLPGGYAFTNAPVNGNYLTFINEINNLEWQAGNTGYIPIRKGSGGSATYGFIKVTIAGVYNGNASDITVDVNMSGISASTGSVTTGNCSTLPVNLTSFAVLNRDNTVNLKWTTASEEYNAGFEVERSRDSENFETIGFVQGNGTTLEAKEYFYEDKNAKKDVIYYYRLKQIDFSGDYEYSNIIATSLSGSKAKVGDFYPNPVIGGSTALEYVATANKELTISVYNTIGQSVKSEIQSVNEGINNLNFDCSDLTKGNYFVKLEAENDVQYKKLIID